MKVYIDNDVASAIKKRDLPEPEQSALDRVLELESQGVITTMFSAEHLREMERYKGPVDLKAGLEGREKVERDHEVLGSAETRDQFGGGASYPLVTDIVDQELFDRFESVGLERSDNLHLTYAVADGCQVFLTHNSLDFINNGRRDALQEASGRKIKIRLPSELVGDIEGGGA